MDEFELIKNYFQKLTKNNPGALKLSDDVFFDKKNKIILSIDTYNEKVHYLNFKKPALIIKKIIINPSDLFTLPTRKVHIYIK